MKCNISRKKNNERFRFDTTYLRGRKLRGKYVDFNLTCYRAACAPSHKMGFRSSVSKSGLPGEGRHEGLVPRNDVLTNGFIGFSLA